MLEIFRDEAGNAALSVGGKRKHMIPVQKTMAVIRERMQDTSLQLHVDDGGRVFAVRYGGRMIPRA